MCVAHDRDHERELFQRHCVYFVTIDLLVGYYVDLHTRNFFYRQFNAKVIAEFFFLYFLLNFFIFFFFLIFVKSFQLNEFIICSIKYSMKLFRTIRCQTL